MEASSPDILMAAAAATGLILLFFLAIEIAARLAVRRRSNASGTHRTLVQSVANLEDELAKRHAMEQQLREAYRMAAMGTVSGGLAHELNNALQPVVTLAGLGIDREDLPEDHKATLHEILTAAEEAAKTVQSTLAFAPSEERDMHEIALSSELAGIVVLAQDPLPPEVAVQTHVAQGECSIRVNRTELGEVMSMLLKNAAEAMSHEGTITVAVDAVTLEPEAAYAEGLGAGRYVQLTVADDGPGLPQAVENRVFEPSFSTRATMRGDGSGLGLAIVYGLVRSWDGNITALSCAGRGAMFKMLIPCTTPGAGRG